MRELYGSGLRYGASQDRFKKPFETVLSPQGARPADPPANDRESARIMSGTVIDRAIREHAFQRVHRPASIQKRQEEQPEHVKRRHSRGDKPNQP